MRFKRIWSRSERKKFANIERIKPETRSRAHAHRRVSPEKADSLFWTTPGKNAIRNQFFGKLFSFFFHLSAFKVISIRTSNPALCQQKEFVLNLKVVHK